MLQGVTDGGSVAAPLLQQAPSCLQGLLSSEAGGVNAAICSMVLKLCVILA